MILVDSSVWIDYFRGVDADHTDALHQLLGQQAVAVGDLMLTEVLQGFTKDRQFRVARDLMTSIPVLEIGAATPPSPPLQTSGSCGGAGSPSAKPSTRSSPRGASWIV